MDTARVSFPSGPKPEIGLAHAEQAQHGFLDGLGEQALRPVGPVGLDLEFPGKDLAAQGIAASGQASQDALGRDGAVTADLLSQVAGEPQAQEDLPFLFLFHLCLRVPVQRHLAELQTRQPDGQALVAGADHVVGI